MMQPLSQPVVIKQANKHIDNTDIDIDCEEPATMPANSLYGKFYENPESFANDVNFIYRDMDSKYR